MRSRGDDDGATRLAGIYRRGKKAARYPRRIAWWSDPPAETAGRVGALLGILLLVVMPPLTAALRAALSTEPAPPAPWLLAAAPARILLLVAWLINAVVLDRWFELLTPRQAAPKPWLRIVRLVLAGTPLLGLYVIPGWRWVVERRPPWAISSAASELSLTARKPFLGQAVPASGRRLWDRMGRRIDSITTLAWLAIGNWLLLLGLIAVPTSMAVSPAALLPLAAAGAAVHLLAFAGVAWFLRIDTRRRGWTGPARLLVCLTALFWLVPVPYFALLGLVPLFILALFAGALVREDTLTHAAYGAHGSAARPPVWRQLEETLRDRRQKQSLWSRLRRPRIDPEKPREPDFATDRLVWLYRVKSIALAFDATGLAWLVLWLTDRLHGPEPWVTGILETLAFGAFALCVMGLGVTVAYMARRALGSAPGRLGILDRHPYAWTLTASQLAFGVGLSLGIALARDDAGEVRAVLLAIGLLGCAVEFFGILARAFLPATDRVKRQLRDELFGLLGFLLLMACGMAMERDEIFAQELLRWLTALTLTAPLWGLVLTRVFLGWLLRPFRLRDAFSPSTPRPLRRRLLLMAATLLLPLGGLAIPWWVLWRHRRWPR